MEDETKKDPRGASRERMLELVRIRQEMAKTDPTKKGGRPRTRFSKQEATDAALERLEPIALKKLELQLDSPDERVAQKAAQLLLEWRRGKPSQSIKQETAVSVVRYESAAWQPVAEIESA